MRIIIKDANKNFVVVVVVKSIGLHGDVTFAEAEAMNLGLSVAIDAWLANIIIAGSRFCQQQEDQ